METDDLIDEIRLYADKLGVNHEAFDTGVGGLSIVRTTESTPLRASNFKPIICLVLQGAKEVYFGKTALEFSAGQSLIVSYSMPTVSRVTKATPEKPYVALALELDMSLIRKLGTLLKLDAPQQPLSCSTIAMGNASPEFYDAMKRLFRLVRKPHEQIVLTSNILYEIHFRVLQSEHASVLRELSSLGSRATRMGEVILRLQNDFAKPINVTNLANEAGMSLSSFHHHFKALTATTPLQFQKNLRLIEARHQIENVGSSVSAAAFKVGYESPTQFSREYAKKFGVPPKSHLLNLKT